jgi:hypothetical protein
MLKYQRKIAGFLLCLTVVAILSGAFVAASRMSGEAEDSYPWCVQGETLQCYYATREQCELTVNCHGFCVANPFAVSQTYSPRQRRGHTQKARRR